MAIELARYIELCNRLATIDLLGRDLKVRPDLRAAAAIRKATGDGAARMPLLYRTGYADLVDAQLDDVLVQLADLSPDRRASILEKFYAPAYEHGKQPARDVRPELHRFLAVVSNL